MIRRDDKLVYGVAFVLALLGHVGTLKGLTTAARRAPKKTFRTVEMTLVRPPPPPEPVAEPEPPRPEPKKPKPKPEPKPPPKEEKVIDLTQEKPHEELPPPPNSDAGEEPVADAKPVFGISMTSVVGPGTGASIAVRVGNTLMKEPEKEYTPPEEVKVYEPVPIYKVTKMPVRRGDCRGVYPTEARDLGIEGAVKLEVEVLSDGSVGKITVLSGLGYGLDAAAVAALKACRFAPGEVNGEPVGTKIPYTYRFYLDE